VSTDYVFGGEATVPYPEDYPRNPQSAYGRTKAAGEERVLSAHPDKSIIIRTAWLYGEHGPNFVSTILSLAASRDSVSVVTDQVGQPTWSKDLARMIANLAYSSVRSGVFHGTNSGQASWWEFARAIYTHAGLDPERVIPTNSAEFVRPAPRPAWSVLGHHEWSTHNLPEPRSWQEAFDEAWSEVFSQRAKN
jgi:dTDP-4-dehydrorhamnose reductase